MEPLCADNQTQLLSLTSVSDTQKDLSLDSVLPDRTEDAAPTIQTENILNSCSEENTKPLLQTASLSVEESTLSDNAPNTSEFFCLPSTTDRDFRVWDYNNSPETESLGGLFTCTVTTNQIPTDLLSMSETLPEQCIGETLLCDSLKSDDGHAARLLTFLMHQSDSSERDIPSAPLTDLHIFESETQDFILSPDLDPQEIKCSKGMSLSQTAVADIQHETNLLEGNASNVVTKYNPDLSEDRVMAHYESEERDRMGLGAPAEDVCNVAHDKAEVNSQSPSPVELWVDACQYLSVEDSEDRNERAESVTQVAPPGTLTSDFSVPLEETQRSGYSPGAGDVIGWSFDDNKSWGPPVERWSSVDSWASALSDWADIISSPAEDLTAAFTEIGAEIDALTQALAEVTTQIEAEQQNKIPGNSLHQSPMGVQDKPLETPNITESSGISRQSCLTRCLGAEIQEKESIEPLPTTEVELENIHRCQTEPQQQPMGSSEVTTSDRYINNYTPTTTTTTTTMTTGSSFEADTDLLDIRFDSLETELNSEVVLSIVEDTDLEQSRTPSGLLINEPYNECKCKVKDEHILSSLDLGADRDRKRSRTPSVTFKVDHQSSEALPGLNFLNTLTPINLHVPRVDTEAGLNVHVLPNTLVDLDRARQVEPQWGSPKFIMPLAPLSIGSSLDTQAGSSLNGDQEAASWVFNDNRDSVYDLWTDSGEITDSSSENSKDDSWPKQTKTDSSTDLKTDEVTECYVAESKTILEESRDLLNLVVIPNDHFTVCEEKQVACFTLDLYDPFTTLFSKPITKTGPFAEKMPHKTHKSSSEGKARSKKDRPAFHSHAGHPSKKQENIPYAVSAEQQPCSFKEDPTVGQDAGLEKKDNEQVVETGVVPQKEIGRRHSKKKKKHAGKATTEPVTEVKNESKTDKDRTDVLKVITKGSDQSTTLHKKTEQSEAKTLPKSTNKQPENTGAPNNSDDDIIKKRRLSLDKFGKLLSSFEPKVSKADTPKGAADKADAGATRRKAYSEVVKQKSVKQEPKVVQPIQAVSVSGDPQSLCLWCQFSHVVSDYTVTWRRDSAVLAEIKRSAGDESRVSLTISNASQKHLGKYQCQLSSIQGTVTLDFLLTYELLSEIVIPATPKITPAAPVEVGHEEESVNCSRLMFKEDFLSEQYFGESHSASIVTEKIHFGEGMHRRAFRTKMQDGQIPLLLPGDPCVLKVHNAISYGTKNNEELVQKNFNLAVEECQVQNTAREYIKAYTAVAQSFEAFGQVPEIIPIYLVHRPSNDIPYATLEEELIGDFVKYSVKDGKEINLMRRDSEAGQKCCAFQHWVYHNTEGNLLVTDMQGVGMRLTDVGIATCKKGYKGFKGNCATSFIDQFKALHQCNRYCEILGLTSLQPKPKKITPVSKSKAQPGATPKKKTFEPTVKGKS